MLNNININQLLTDGSIGFIVGLFVVVAFIYLLPWLKKRVNLDKVLPVTKEVLDNVDESLDTINSVVNIPQLQVIDKIIEFASVGVGNAEQLYKSEKLLKDQRKINARSAVSSMLQELKIDITPQRQNIIDIAVENAVNQLPSISATTQSVTSTIKDPTLQIQGTTGQTLKSVSDNNIVTSKINTTQQAAAEQSVKTEDISNVLNILANATETLKTLNNK